MNFHVKLSRCDDRGLLNDRRGGLDVGVSQQTGETRSSHWVYWEGETGHVTCVGSVAFSGKSLKACL